ncbi:MAG: type II toxin-antitoxin system HicB family antitoxin [Acidobacteriia bacterium]|jgi:predicted RNase H-like HicB family nuclease|nr:type II toxin-antitoxin system HicB family antitoxin [Terriglobia bacterium]
MKTAKFTYWQDGDFFLGFLNEYPDYQTQGMSKEELVNNLKDLLADLESGEIPYIRKVEDLVVAD